MFFRALTLHTVNRCADIHDFYSTSASFREVWLAPIDWCAISYAFPMLAIAGRLGPTVLEPRKLSIRGFSRSAHGRSHAVDWLDVGTCGAPWKQLLWFAAD